jgi:hypothetical protein
MEDVKTNNRNLKVDGYLSKVEKRKEKIDPLNGIIPD